MLKEYINLPEPELGKRLEKFSTALSKGRFSIRKDMSLIFLCGANKEGLIPSERRKFLKTSIEKNLPNARVLYAEFVMEELAKHGKTKNLLDIEHSISDIANWIVIVLESFSAFCELGAFAHKDFRKKLVIINDSEFKETPSFINHGPILAIQEDISEDRVIWYPMSKDGVHSLDAIGMTLPSLLETIKKTSSKEKLGIDAYLPSTQNQASLLFLHDIIYMCGPISHTETISIYESIFGKHPFDNIKILRGILHASGLITTKIIGREKYYLSKNRETFIEFLYHTNNLITAFRRYHLKHNPDRFSHV